MHEVKQPSKLKQMVFSRTTEGSAYITQVKYNDVDAEPWGDPLCAKGDGTIRIVSKQIGGLGITAGNSKERELKSWIIENEIDCIGLQELNVFWKKCSDKSQFRERMRHHRWEFVRTSTAFNKHEFTALNQFGGTAIVTNNIVASRVCCTGADETGLGRWAWVKYRGRNKSFARVISVYQPHRPANENLHPKSVYRQHQRYWMDKNSDQCPIIHFHDDLCTLLQKWIKNKEKVVLLIDANESISDSPLRTRLESLGMISVYKTKFGTGSLPATYHRGKDMIDDIFTTKNFCIDRAGMFAFGDGPGDHRGLYIDVDLESFIGKDEYTAQRIQARRLISTNPLVTEKFNRLFEQQLQRHHLHERIDELYRSFTVPMTKEYIETYEKLDRIQVSAFEYANKRCRKLRCGDIPSSDILNYHGSLIRLWTYVIRKKQGCKVSSKMIARIAAACDVEKPMSTSIALANEWRAQAWKDYNYIKDDPCPARDDYMNRLYEKISEEEGIDKAEVILRKKQREEIRNAHRRIKFARKKGNSGGTMKLEIDNPHGNGTIEVTDKIQMENILMKTNEEKFRLACATPFVQGQLLQDLGPCGMTIAAEKVLRGTYEPPQDIHLGAQNFIDSVRMSEAVLSAPPISAAITADEHIHFWKSQRESTQSSPSGLHFGYMKTTCKVPRLAETVAKFVSIPFESGYSPDRWRNSINVTLMKEEGEFRPEKQRTIHLLESSFSEGCKMIFSRRMMQHARKLGQIPPDQYARKGGKSIDAAIQKILTYDVMRLQKRAGVCFANDLMANYDRMAHVPSGLALRSLGAPPSAVQCMSTTIQTMKHYIRTAYGDSEKYYGGNPSRPLQGGGQGSPAAPPMWIALTIIVIRMLSAYEPGVTVFFAISTAILTFSAILYVDDTDLFILQKEGETIDELLTRAQNLTSRWVEAMWATGAALRPEKCWWCLVEFKWTGSIWRYTFCDEVDGILQVRDDNGDYQQIKRVDVREGNKGLGLRFSADGNMSMELEYLRKTSQSWAANIQNSFLDRRTSALALTSTIFGTWAYPSSATNFSRKECDLLVKPVFSVILPKIGVNRHLPKQYRYASLSHHGLGLQDYYVNQGVDHIVKLIEHMAKHTYDGDLMEATLELAMLEIGTGINLFHLNYDKYSFLLTDCWIKIPWKCCSDNQIVVEGNYHLPRLARTNDKFLMDMVVASDLLTRKEKQVVNRCRLFLKVICLSDICSGDGKTVSECYYHGDADSDRISCLGWPNQGRPTRAEWKIWKRCVEIIWAPLPNLHLSEHLGPWIRHSHQHWRWFYHDGILYYNNDAGYFEVYHNSISSSRRSQRTLFFRSGTCINEISPDAQAATIYRYSQGCVRFEGAAPFQCNKDDDYDDVCREQEIISKLLSSGRWLHDGIVLAEAIAGYSAVCVADGSFHPEYQIGTAGYVFDDGKNSVVGMGGHRVPGPKHTQCSYRSELFGIYLSLLAVKVLCDKHNVTQGRLTIGCDNLGALDKGLREQFFPSVQHKHYDLIWAIHSLRHELSIEVAFRHVLGHQDIKTNEPLDRWAQLNLMADAEAKRQLSWYIGHPDHDIDLNILSPHWKVRVQGDIITQNIRQTLQTYVHDRDIEAFLIRKGTIDKETYRCIDWSANGTAMKALSFYERTWVTKHVSGFCGCGKMMVRCKKWDSPACPRCGDCVEDNWHVLWCDETIARSIRHGLTQKVDTWLRENNTHPALHLLIIRVFQKGSASSFVQCSAGNLDPAISALAREQDSIGLKNFFYGRLSKKWGSIQHQHLRLHVPTSRRSGSSWVAGLIKQIYRWSRSQWESRNSVVHDRESEAVAIQLLSKTDQRIRKEFSLGFHGLRASDRYVFSGVTEKDILSKKQSDKEVWLQHMHSVRRRAHASEATQMDKMRMFMERWKRRKK